MLTSANTPRAETATRKGRSRGGGGGGGGGEVCKDIFSSFYSAYPSRYYSLSFGKS